MLERGRRIAKKYVLERPAGFGGMAEVWVATNQATGAEVCVKLLVLEGSGDEDEEEAALRFRREAHAAASLSHRAIVRVFDLLELDERGELLPAGARAPRAYAIVMELLHGETLGDVLARRGAVPLEEALDIFSPILSALGHAHRASVIHRDLKPDNIFLATEPDGHVIPKVLDFGVSKLEGAAAITVDGVIVGTPCFMSPEQAKGARRIDARSDVFSAGVLLYTALGGSNPFEGASTFAETVDAVLRRRLAPIAELPGPIWSVIERATEKDPARRFADAVELGDALGRAAGRKVTTESEPSFAAAAPSPSRLVEGGGALSGDPPPASAPRAVDPAVTVARSGPGVERGVAAARRWRAAVVAVAVAAAAIGLAAALLVSRGPAAREAPDRASLARGGASAPVVDVDPAPSAPSAASPAAPSPSRPELPADAPPTSAGADAKSGRGAGAARAPSSAGTLRRPASSAAPRRPGEEPHNARDPGF